MSNWRVANSLLVLRDQVDALYPGRSKASDGTIGDVSHQSQGSASDHNPNIFDAKGVGVVTAWDCTHDPGHGLDIQKLGDALIASRDPRIKYLIANRQIVIPSNSWTWVPYTGVDPHTNHIHISVNPTNYDDANQWNLKGANQVYVEKAELDDLRLWKSRATAPGKVIVDDAVVKDALEWKSRAVGNVIIEPAIYQDLVNWKSLGMEAVKELQTVQAGKGAPTNSSPVAAPVPTTNSNSEWVTSYIAEPTTIFAQRDVLTKDMEGILPPVLVARDKALEIAGHFHYQGKVYYRTVMSEKKNRWVGIPEEVTEPLNTTSDASPIPVILQPPVGENPLFEDVSLPEVESSNPDWLHTLADLTGPLLRLSTSIKNQLDSITRKK